MKEFVLKYKYIFISVCALLIILIGGTYAWVNIEILGSKTNKIVSGSLVMNLDESTCTEINITNAHPMTDEEGMKQVACEFTLENTGTLNSGYNLYLDDAEIDASLTRMSDSDVKIGLVKNTGSAVIKLVSDTGVNPNRIIDSGVLAVGGSNTYELRLWIDNDAGNDAMGKTLSTKLRVSGEVNNSSECFDIPSYGGEPNPPEMIGDMIPVTYDGVNWVKADINNNLESWYNYDEQVWANAVTVTEASRSGYLSAPVGTTIDFLDINLALTWIPRYSYTKKDDFGVQGCGGGTASANTPGAFDIKFIDTNVTDLGSASYTGNTAENWFTNSAFCWGNTCDDESTRNNLENREISGLWVEKLGDQTKYGEILYDYSSEYYLPLVAIGSDDLSFVMDEYKSNLSGSTGVSKYGLTGSSHDAHIIKNTEWGALIYLAQSRYGKYGNTSFDSETKEFKSSNEEISGSSTGNYSGILSLYNGSVVMANLSDELNNLVSNNSGFTNDLERKYYNKYENINDVYNYNFYIKGDVSKEVDDYYNSYDFLEVLEGSSISPNWLKYGGYNKSVFSNELNSGGEFGYDVGVNVKLIIVP